MSPKRTYFGLISLLCLLCVSFVVSAFSINSMLTARAAKLTSLKAKDQALDQEQLSLVQAQKNLPKYEELQKIAQAVVPEDKDQAEAVRQIVNIAAANGVSLSAVNFPASSLGNSGAGTAAGGTTTGPAPVSIGQVKINPSTGKLSQLQPVKNIPGVYVLQLTVQSDPNRPVSYDSFINFLKALERNRRTAQITNITLQPKTDNPGLLSFTLNINEYIKP